MELSRNQIKIVKAPEDRIVVIAAASSGKTQLLTQRIKYLLDRQARPEKMVAITFTNNAADEMRQRLGFAASDMFIGTIHAYANYLLLSKGIDTSKKIKEDDFDGFFELIKEHPECMRQVDYLFLDEAQDLNTNQFNFIFDMIKPLGFFVVGDFRQSIYQYAGGRPDLFCGLTSYPDVKTYELNENYRNGVTILDFAKWILRVKANDFSKDIYYYDNSIACSGRVGNKYNIDYNEDEFAKLIKKKAPYKEWFVLTRSNQQLETVYRQLTNLGIPCDTFKQADLTRTQLQDKMNNDTVKVLTIHASKGLEANNVIVIGMNMYNEEESRLGYVAATRAKDNLYWVRGLKKKFPRRPKNASERITSWE